MQRTILLVSELGGGLGHARRLLLVAATLKDQGFAPVVALRDLWSCVGEFADLRVPVVQSPVHRSQWPAGRPRVRSYADLSAGCGFQTVEALWPVVLGWNALFDIVRPQAVVADYSPVASLAAFDRCPVIAIGDGFVLPPPHLPGMPVLRAEGTAMADEATQMHNATAVQRRLGRRAPSTLPGLIGGQAHIVCTYPELDIYAGLRLREASGRLQAGDRTLPPPTDRRIFAYLSARAPNTRETIGAAIATRLPVEVFIRDLGEDDRRDLQAMPLALHPTPPPLPNVLARCSLLVHHGGIGTMESCLAAGRPQLLVPSHFEQQLNARNAADHGLALTLADGDIAAHLADAARDLALETAVLPSVAPLSQHIARRPPTRAMDEIVDACRLLSA